MKPQEANKLIAEFMGCTHPFNEIHDATLYKVEQGVFELDELRYHTSWDWLMPVITKVKSIDYDWIDQEGHHTVDHIDHALTCCWGIDEVHRCTVEAIMNYNEYKS